MKKILEQLIAAAKTVRLSPPQKEESRLALERLLVKHPAATAVPRPATVPPFKPHFFNAFFSSSSNRKYLYAGAFATLLLALSTSLGVLAQDSLPGSPLYPIKVGITEELRFFFATTAQERLSLALDRVELRLSEAEALASVAQLRSPIREVVQQRYKTQADSFSTAITQLEKKDASAARELRARSEVDIQAHEKILTRLAQDTSKNPAAVASLLALVQQQRDEAAREREATDQQLIQSSDVQSAARERMHLATNAVLAGRQFIANSKGQLTSDEIAELEAQLVESEKQITEGKAQVSQQQYAAAYLTFGRAEREAKVAKLVAKAQHSLRLNVPLPLGEPASTAGGSASPSLDGSIPPAGAGSPSLPPTIIKIDLGL